MDNGKSKLITKRIKVYGIVQGVGFRPLVYRVAKKYSICGTVRNVGGYVDIMVQADNEAMEGFLNELQNGDNGQAQIVKLEIEEIVNAEKHNIYRDFVILESGNQGDASIIPPDLPVCAHCQKELLEETDRRHLNPFISCMSCGPRYTIMAELPYDRDNTTMVDFKMCPDCQTEYTNTEDRRLHAQTISCYDCGPYLIFQEKLDKLSVINELVNAEAFDVATNKILKLTDKAASNKELERAITVINRGGIIAVKGIGGYHLVCSPFREDTVQNLRKLKGREEKPFAVMFPDLEQIKTYCQVSKEEEALLKTNARPIVLLYLHTNNFAPSTVRGSMYCGAFLPYTPLQHLLLRACGPLIMTSANYSSEPIIREDAKMLSMNSEYLDGVLYNTRRIIRSVDDSVAKIMDGKPQLIRRSRGYVPYPVFIEQDRSLSTEINNKHVVSNSIVNQNREIEDVISNKVNQNRDIEDVISNTVNQNRDIEEVRNNEKAIFAAGGDLKATFCLYHNGKAVLSQYFGDLEEISVLEEYKNSLQDLSRLLKVKPALAVCDLHPNYYSTGFTKTLGIPVLQVQHHHAHVASVMAEHHLKGKVIGVSFDGTGYGTDGNIWGGEFLVCEGAEYIRAGQLEYSLMLGGDDSMRDARKTASCFLIDAGLEEYVQDERKPIIKAALLHRVNTVKSSSAGRFFDAVASILDIAHTNRYEGECGALLEREAVLAKREGKKPTKLSFAIEKEYEIIKIDSKPVLETLCRLREKEDRGALALGFHYAVADAILEVCLELKDKYETNCIALSGGVFQNTVLSEKVLEVLRKKEFKVYVNLAVPPNDGGISLGQVYIGLYQKG
ncbi:MAG: hypF [Herbinix sp.]|nr:hypF [Herbinix sp.]